MKPNRFFSKRAAIILLGLLLAVLIPMASVHAAEFPKNPVVGKDEVIDDDVFLSGEAVMMDGTILGTLFASGGTVTINGKVTGDAILAGNTVVISDQAEIGGNVFVGASEISIAGKVNGSIFGGASTMTLASGGTVARNLFYGGFSLEAEPGTTVQKDLNAAGYQVMLAGEVSRDINVGAAAVELNGIIGRNAILEVAEPGTQPYYGPMPPGITRMINPGLRIANSAEIGGKLVYTSPVDQGKAIQAEPGGGVVFQTPVPEETVQKPGPGGETKPAPAAAPFLAVLKWTLNRVRLFAVLLVLGGLALWKIPAVLHKTVQVVKSQPLPSLGYGFVVVILGFSAAFVIGLAILLLGIFFGVITLGALGKIVMGIGFSSLSLVMSIFLLLVTHGSKVVIAFLLGLWIVKLLAPNSTLASKNILALVLGSILYVVLRAIPVLGLLIGLVATLAGLGAIWLTAREWRLPWKLGKALPVEEPAI